MQVSEQKDHITHAVIGGGQTIDFGISNSAEFFNILSSTLYKDQILAVAREVLCNAWDAHIEAGCTDKPVEITLTDDKLIIKDYGKGIHRDDMGLIYGTYGNSTKKNDGKQTGGFGLGCKAPFAYTDHFEVVSSHDGVRTIYNLSKSSAQAMGKPGIVPIASFPYTADTGLTVTIPILKQSDNRRFYTLINRIVRNGDMNMSLNGNKIQTIGFDNTKASVLITLNSDLIENQPRIMIRYGNVIYPVDMVPELAGPYNEVKAHLEKLSYYRDDKNYYIVFQAPPHSIAVTPSRESLSMQGHTIKTLQTLFNDFMTMLKNDFPPVCDQFAISAVQQAVKEERIPALLSVAERLPIKDIQHAQYIPKTIDNLESMARRFMEKNYPSDIGFRKRDYAFRLKEMVTAGQLDRGLVQTYLRALENVKGRSGAYSREASEWLQKHVVARAAGRIIKAGLPVDRLYVYDPEDQNAPRGYYRGVAEAPIVEAHRASPKHLFNGLPYLRNIIVIATSTHKLMERCKPHDVFKKMGDNAGFLFYRVSMKKAEKEAVIALFKATNMQVVDMTVRQPWELALTGGVALPPAPRKKPKTGVVCLTAIAHGLNSLYLGNITQEDADRIDNPEFMVEVSLRADVSKSSISYDWDGITSRYIVDLFGDKGGITNNSAVATKYKEKGAKDFSDYVYEKVSEHMILSPTIQEYWAFHPERAMGANKIEHYDSKALVKVIYKNPLLCAEYGLVNNLTDVDKKYLHIWNHIINNQRHYNGFPQPIADAITLLNTIVLDPANYKLLGKFKANKLLDVIDEDGLGKLLSKNDAADPDVLMAIKLLNIVLK